MRRRSSSTSNIALWVDLSSFAMFRSRFLQEFGAFDFFKLFDHECHCSRNPWQAFQIQSIWRVMSKPIFLDCPFFVRCMVLWRAFCGTCVSHRVLCYGSPEVDDCRIVFTLCGFCSPAQCSNYRSPPTISGPPPGHDLFYLSL